MINLSCGNGILYILYHNHDKRTEILSPRAKILAPETPPAQAHRAKAQRGHEKGHPSAAGKRRWRSDHGDSAECPTSCGESGRTLDGLDKKTTEKKGQLKINNEKAQKIT